MDHKGLMTTVAAVCALLLAAAPSAGFSRRPPEPAHVPGKVVVRFQSDVSVERAEEIISTEGAEVGQVVRRTGVYLVLLPEGADVQEAVTRFSAHPEVLYARPESRAEPLEER
ncbi:MAG: hypothetical protein JSV00_05995 [bacterium]|nr:MAG: hypothetical protein JSV00_05995 [bacterium]